MTDRRVDPVGWVHVQRDQLRLHRTVCSKPECPAAGWTVYPPGRYPGRRFGLDVVTKAATTAVWARNEDDRPMSMAAVGRKCGCSGRSVSRWMGWIVGLTDLAALARTCAQFDPDGQPVTSRPAVKASRARAGWALAVFDRFAAILESRGVLPRDDQPSLVRLLDDQRLRHGLRFPPRNLSPPMSAGMLQTSRHERPPPTP